MVLSEWGHIMKFQKLGVYSTLIYGKGGPSRFREGGQSWPYFHVLNFSICSSLKYVKGGDPLGSERGVKFDHNSNLC